MIERVREREKEKSERHWREIHTPTNLVSQDIVLHTSGVPQTHVITICLSRPERDRNF